MANHAANSSESSPTNRNKSIEPIKRHILLTGSPGCGKTTIIKKVIQALPIPANGFYAEEVCVGEDRVGFMMHTLDGKVACLAHKNSSSSYRIHMYGVNIENIEDIAIPAIAPMRNPIIVIDEIGLMQCLSKKFITATSCALDSDRIVIGTIPLQNTDVILNIKSRKDIEILEVTTENRDRVPQMLLLRLEELLMSKAYPQSSF